MAKVVKGILGIPGGKIGSLNGYQWKGVPTVRSNGPKKVKGKNVSQVNARSKMAFISRFVQSLPQAYLDDIWHPGRKAMTKKALYTKYNFNSPQVSNILDPLHFQIAPTNLAKFDIEDIQYYAPNDWIRGIIRNYLPVGNYTFWSFFYNRTKDVLLVKQDSGSKGITVAAAVAGSLNYSDGDQITLNVVGYNMANYPLVRAISGLNKQVFI